VDASKRADAGKRNVIISEKKDKKAAKYLVKDLPYPYTSKDQFTRSMATPIGTEWNTRVAHQRAVLPRVVKKVRLWFVAVSECYVEVSYRWELLSTHWNGCFERCIMLYLYYVFSLTGYFITGVFVVDTHLNSQVSSTYMRLAYTGLKSLSVLTIFVPALPITTYSD
jgi:hypothetical protein